MYEAYWQLLAKPFDTCADARFYYPSEVHQGALLKLRYAVENRRGGALLAGGSGSGKTLLVGWLRKQLAENHTPFVHVVFPQMSPAELLTYIADEVGAPPTHGGLDQTVRRLQQFLIGNTSQGRHAVIAVDEAHLLAEAGNLETLRLLTNFDNGSQPTLTLLLVGQTSLMPALDRMPALEERLGVKCVLRPFTSDETASYVTHRLSAAGASGEIFTPDALTRLHQLARGNPRRINRLCDLALLIGFAEEQDAIEAAHIEAVAGELVNVGPDA
jgi:type II secretory pathway predicted ATPase ExeA